MNTFKSFSLLPAIQESLDALGFTKPTEIQEKIIPTLIEDHKKDVHAQAQTGTGKTLAFGIPLLHAVDPSIKKVQGLVLAPTRELVCQIYEALKVVSRGTEIHIEPVYGGMDIVRQIKNIKRGAQIIIGTPGRINDHIRRKSLKLGDLKVFVLDEADIMLDMGFREEIDEVLTIAPKGSNIWLFSATVMAGIKKLIKSHMHDVVSVKSEKAGASNAQVKQYYCLVPGRKRIETLTRFIEAAANFNGIVFCRTKALVSEVTEELASKGMKVNCLHGDMKQTLRNHVIKGFKNKDFTIMVATDVAARGIDVSDLTHVINFNIPDDSESYTHRIGRTGRAGKEGTAILLITKGELAKVKRLERELKGKIVEIAIPPVEAIINLKMTAVSDFIEQAKLGEKKHAAVEKAITGIVESFSQEEVQKALKVALREKFFQGVDERKKLVAESGVVPQEICMELGFDNGLEEEQVYEYLHSVCKLQPQEIRKVRVLNKKTFISISEARLKEVLEHMKASPLGKKTLKVYLVEDDYRPEKRFGGRGGDRRGGGGRGGDRRGGSGRRDSGSRGDRSGSDRSSGGGSSRGYSRSDSGERERGGKKRQSYNSGSKRK